MATEKLPSTSIFLFLLFLSLGRMLAQTTSAGDSNVPPTPQTAPAEEETAPAKAKIPLTVAPPIPTPPGAPPVPAGLTATYFDPRIVGYAFRSEVLGKKMAFTIVYPQDYAATGAPWPVLFFLHGLGRNEHTLIDDPSSRQKLLDQPYVIVLPKGENGWYFDSPVDPKRHYAAYLDEVMAQAARVANISAERPERAIGGWSAGGFGSVWACLHHPESFSTLATIIGVVDFPSAGTRFKVPEATFGKDPALWPGFDPLNRAAELKNLNIRLVIGEQSSDSVMNERLAQALTTAGFAPDVVRIPGGHTFPTVQAGLGPVLDFVGKHLPPRSPAKP